MKRVCRRVAECFLKAGWVQAEIHLFSCGRQISFRGQRVSEHSAATQPAPAWEQTGEGGVTSQTHWSQEKAGGSL